MSDAQREIEVSPPGPPLFIEDLGTNGGILAATSVAELQQWVSKEVAFWNWAQNVNVGPHRNAFDQALGKLVEANQLMTQAVQQEAQGNREHANNTIARVPGLLREAFSTRKLPHSSTAVAKRIAELRVNPVVAHAYLYAIIGDAPGLSTTIGPANQETWHGLLLGLTERYGIVNSLDPTVVSQRQALEELQAKTTILLEEKKKTVESLERNIASLAADIASTKNAQGTEFSTLVGQINAAHAAALNEHGEKMAAIQKAYKEAMALRSPVEYWDAKATKHGDQTKRLLWWMFGSMAVLASLFLGLTYIVFSTLYNGKPDSWKIAAPILVGVVAVWAVRLIVRMYLSQSHLAADAEERVTMVKTYLSLLEEGKMPDSDDRKLVLTPLFRPATDGIVKEDAIPHPALDFLTKVK